MKKIYLDYQSSTPCAQEVVDKMVPFLVEKYGNPHARSHSFGWEANEALKEARVKVSEAIGSADPKTILFTSGATESNNLAIKGLAHFWQGQKKHIIATCIEHKCALEALKTLEREGFEITWLDVDKNGLINLKELEKAARKDTLLITVAAVNHEIGVIQPMEEIGKIAKKHNVFFHTDSAQALGKIVIDVEKWNVDLMSLSAHKTYGPKGVGALYVRTKPKRVRLKPLNDGGGQERGMRSGTTPVFLAVGMSKACELFANAHEIEKEHERLQGLKRRFLDGIADIPHIFLNGHAEKRIPHNINISIAGIEGESLMMKIPQIAIASGSACTSANLEPSYVLKAIGVPEGLLHSSLRLSLGRDVTVEDIDSAVQSFKEAVGYLRSISPVWERIEEEGIEGLLKVSSD